MPFEIPESWEWCKVRDFSYVASGSTPDKSAFVDDGIPFLKMYNLKNQSIDFDYKPQYIKEEIHNGKLQRSRTEVGDLIMNIVGPPLGKLAIIPPSLPQSNFNQAAVLIRPILQKDTLVRYLFYYLSQMSEINSIQTRGNAGQNNISLTQCQNIRVSMPPLSEQKRIVAEIEKWFALIDDVESNKQDLLDFIKAAKSKIISLAISGKLVPQDPNDQPAIDLLHGINPNFKSSDNSHYENLPEGWQIAPMRMLCDLTDGDKQNGIKRINLDVKYLRGKGDGNVLTAGRFVPANSTMILVDGENSGEVFITPIDGYQGSTFKLLNISDEIYKPFIMYVIKSHQKNFKENKVGSAIPHLNKKLFKEIDVLVPPFEEQKRIAQQIDKTLATLDTIALEL